MIGEPRAFLYDFAIIAFMAAGLEMLVHLCIAQATAEWGYQFWVGLFAVCIFANGFPIMIAMFTWQGMYHADWVIGKGWWAPLEMASAASYLFLFGAGFFLGPALLFLAATIRLADWMGLEWKWAFTGRVKGTRKQTTPSFAEFLDAEQQLLNKLPLVGMPSGTYVSKYDKL